MPTRRFTGAPVLLLPGTITCYAASLAPVICLPGFIVVSTSVPETKGASLEELETFINAPSTLRVS